LQTGNYRPATFIYRGPAGDTLIEEVGFRTKGRSSRIVPQDDAGNFHRAHFKIKFNAPFALAEGSDGYATRDKRRFCTLRSLILRLPMGGPSGRWDVSQMRELYCYDLVNRAGVHTSRTGSARLTITIDGTPRYFGVYTLIEPINKSFLTVRYGRDGNDGNLYKCVTGASGPSTLQPLDANTSWGYRFFFPSDEPIGVKDWQDQYLPTYDLKTNEDEADHSCLIDFIDSINSLAGAELQQYLEAHFDVDRFLRYLAINVLLGKWDDYWTMGNNYYLYFHNDGKAEFIPNDYDMALGGGYVLFYDENTGIYEWGNHFKEFLWYTLPYTREFLDKHMHFESPLVDAVLGFADYRQRYEEYFAEFIRPENRLFLYSDYAAQFSRLRELYEPWLDNAVNENEEMLLEETAGRYMYGRTRSVIEELGLDVGEYETGPLSLDAPENLAASGGTFRDAVALSWDAVLLADYYRVYRASTAGGAFVLLADNCSETAFREEGLPLASLRYYKVQALARDGIAGELSPAVAGTTNDGRLAVPAGVTATDGTYSHMVRVAWDPALNADGYRVYRASAPEGTYAALGETGTDEFFHDRAAEADVTYYYCVAACSAEGAESDCSVPAAGAARTAGVGAPAIIPGEPVVAGSYSRTYSFGTDTYLFKRNGTCIRWGYNPQNPEGGRTRMAGTWGYDAAGTTLVVSMERRLMGGIMEIKITEVWDRAFVTDNGTSLYLMGLRKTTADTDRLAGRYEASGLNIARFGMAYPGDLYRTAAVHDNGTLVGAYDDYNRVESRTRTWSSADNILISYNGEYFLHDPELSSVFTRDA
ncbi:CotH kinase family protein, partial [Thermodesulfobacteriota bacterium]